MGIMSRSRGLIRIRYFGSSEFSENGEVWVVERTVFYGFFVHPFLNFCYWIWVFFLSECFVFFFDGLDFDLSFSRLGIMRFTMLIILGGFD